MMTFNFPLGEGEIKPGVLLDVTMHIRKLSIWVCSFVYYSVWGFSPNSIYYVIFLISSEGWSCYIDLCKP